MKTMKNFLVKLGVCTLFLLVITSPNKVDAWWLDGQALLDKYPNLNNTNNFILNSVNSCFPAGTKVSMKDGEIKEIERVNPGDMIVSQSENGEKTTSRVMSLESPVRDHMCQVSFEGGDSLKLTNEHPISTKEGWKSLEPDKTKEENQNLIVGKLEIGDEVFKKDGTFSKVVSSSCWSQQIQTYNLILDQGAHTYFADDYLVHNKSVITDGIEVWSWTCFAAGTQVLMSDPTSPGGLRGASIEDVKVGDKVVSQDEKGKRSVSTVTGLDQPIREQMCRLDFTNGTFVKMTEEHPLMTKEGWKALDPNRTKDENPDLIVKKLGIGDVVIREDGEATLQNISCWSAKTPAYNLILDNGAHTYFADGFLAHNKGKAAMCSRNCVAGTHPDWTTTTISCKYGEVGKIEGNAVRGGNFEYCAWWGEEPCGPNGSRMCKYYIPRDRGCEYAACAPDCPTPDSPTLVSPADNTVLGAPSGSAAVDFSWNGIANWGADTGTTRRYILCVGPDSTSPCTAGGVVVINEDATSPVTNAAAVTVTAGQKYWGVAAMSKCGGVSESEVRKVCVEGFVEPTGAEVANKYLSSWSTCSPTTHKRTRACTEDCGTDNCAAMAAIPGKLSQDCLGEVRGTLFDASNLSSCPSFDPLTGYLVGLESYQKAPNMSFGFVDAARTGTGAVGYKHPWPLISPTTATTDANGNYTIRVYTRSTYNYDFTAFANLWGAEVKPKLTCQAKSAVFLGSAGSCLTQPCTILNNMSFGFQRDYGGWWQAVGAGVHGEKGLRSLIPSTLTTNEYMLLGDATAENRVGVASAGELTSKDSMLGINPDAKVSYKEWLVENKYEGLKYDWGYFNQHFKKFSSMAWNGTMDIVYNDGGKGYQIFTYDGNVDNFAVSPTGTNKMIFLVKGNVKITDNIVVPVGAYLAVIAEGDIVFGTNVAAADGWYVAKNINVPCINVSPLDGLCDKTDVQFVGSGSFVGWSNIILMRDMGLANDSTPTEKFVYRKDLYDNAPEPMKAVTKNYSPFIP